MTARSIETVDAADSDRFRTARQALAGVPMAVVLVGAGRTDERSCATGTAMYVSFAPPRLVVALHPGSRTCALVEATERFSISVLAADQVEVAVRAGHAGGGPDKFATLGLEVATGPHGTPALLDCRLALWCRVVETHLVGDHRLFVGEVEAYDRSGLDDPTTSPALVRHRRRYASIGAWLSDEAPEGYPT